jgi:asparagine synthase (glutamine-hydrolysing)
MCGIVGVAGSHTAAWVQEMNGMIVHRGPDDQGMYSSPAGDVSLAMRRLSILDLEGGHQPMSSQDQSVWIVFNGEIYNAPELRADLESRGHTFVTAHSDTEVLLHLYDEKGDRMVDDLNGMFAFVIHDQRRNRLFGARDRMGIKPLYYSIEKGLFVFASELKSLLVSPLARSRTVNRQTLSHFMQVLYVPGAEAIIDNVFRVPPGHSFVYDLKHHRFTLSQYWQIDGTCFEDHDIQEWSERVRSELRAAVSRWTLSDVPIACSLSGGIDSSAIIGLLAEQGFPQVRTYSLGFAGDEEQAWNELHLAREVADRWGTLHHELILNPTDLLNDLVEMVWHLDEPYGGGLPAWYVYREMSKDVKVGLNGMGGDELFGNYEKFKRFEDDPVLHAAVTLRQRSRGGAGALALCASPLGAVSDRLPASWPVIGRGRLFSKLSGLLETPFGSYYRANLDCVSDGQTEQFVRCDQDGLGCQSTAEYLQQIYDASRTQDLRTGLAVVDFQTQLAEEFLFMTDRFSMAHGIEARTPFLDHRLVELVFRIPPSIRTKSGDPKYLLKRAVSDLLPHALLTARKRGFTIPIGLWLRGALRPLAERLLAPDRLTKQGLLRPEFYHHYVEPHLEGRADFAVHVWAALMFQLWHLVFIEEACTMKPSFTWKDLC